jgi:hypothetical protein
MGEQYAQAWWGTWWPWAEANQGLLSVVALVLALGFALWENHRANGAELKARQENDRRERDLLNRYIDGIEELRRLMRARLTAVARELDAWSPSDRAHAPLGLTKGGREGGAALRLFATAAPPNPTVMLATIALTAVFDGAAELSGAYDAKTLRAKISNLQIALDEHEKQLADLAKRIASGAA